MLLKYIGFCYGIKQHIIHTSYSKFIFIFMMKYVHKNVRPSNGILSRMIFHGTMSNYDSPIIFFALLQSR